MKPSLKMNKKGKDLLARFIADEEYSKEDLSQLKDWLQEEQNSSGINNFLKEEWNKKDEKDTDLSIIDIKRRIKENGKKIPFIKKLVLSYQRVAAILLLPILFVSIYLLLNHFREDTIYFTSVAERGQKSQVVLPDGTSVWLNSDSRISYPDNFGRKERNVLLTGEAYFEVTKNTKVPFVVETGEAEVKVLGTIFNLKAYDDDNEIETTLIEGKIELTVRTENLNITSKTLELRPGESVLYDKRAKELHYSNFKNDEVVGWKNNQLIFRNDNFEKLVKKIERWYDVKVIYDQESLNEQHLTVELYQGERLNRLLDILELAMDVKCISEKDKIYIRAKAHE